MKRQNQTRNRSLLLLAIVFVAAAALLAIQRTQQNAVEPTTTDVLYFHVFPSLTATDIQAIRLRSPETGDSFTIARTTDGSWATPNGSTTVDATVADNIAKTLEQLPYSRTLPLNDGDSLQIYGFAPEGVLSIEFVLSDDTSHAIAVGYRTPMDDGYYALIDDRTDLYLLSRPAIDYLISRLKTPPIA